MKTDNQTLASHPLFADVASSEVRRLDQLCSWISFDEGATIVAQLDEDRDVYFIVRGRAKVLIDTEDGQEVYIRELIDGDMFGELAALDGRPRSASVVAATRGYVAHMSPELFRQAIHENNVVCDRVLAALATEIRRLAQRLNERETLPVISRLVLELLRQARPVKHSSGQAIISPPPRHLDLAGRIGTHRERVTKDLKQLEDEGLLSRDRRRFLIPDMQLLKERARR